MMKKLILLSTLLVMCSAAQANNFKESLQDLGDAASATFKSGVDAVKEGGQDGWRMTKEGFDAGKDQVTDVYDKSIDSIKSWVNDGNNVTDGKSLKEFLQVSVAELKFLDEDNIVVTVIFRNEGDKAVNLKGLGSSQNIILLDSDNIASFANSESLKANETLVVPPQAAIKTHWTFDSVSETPADLRIFDVKYQLAK